LDVELGGQLLFPLLAEDFGAEDQCPGNSFAAHQFAQDQQGTDRLAKPDIVGKQEDRKAAAEGEEVLDLMEVWVKAVTPIRPRLNVLRTVDDNGLGQIPFEGGQVKQILFKIAGWAKWLFNGVVHAIDT
jgi:hypothetical protein